MYDQQIDVEKSVSDVKEQPYNLPAGFYWADVDMSDAEQVKEVYELLT